MRVSAVRRPLSREIARRGRRARKARAAVRLAVEDSVPTPACSARLMHTMKKSNGFAQLPPARPDPVERPARSRLWVAASSPSRALEHCDIQADYKNFLTVRRPRQAVRNPFRTGTERGPCATSSESGPRSWRPPGPARSKRQAAAPPARGDPGSAGARAPRGRRAAKVRCRALRLSLIHI